MEDKDCLIDSLHLHGLKYTIFFQRAWLFSLTGVTQKRNPICLAFLWLDFYPAPFLQHRTTPSCPVLTHPSLLTLFLPFPRAVFPQQFSCLQFSLYHSTAPFCSYAFILFCNLLEFLLPYTPTPFSGHTFNIPPSTHSRPINSPNGISVRNQEAQTPLTPRDLTQVSFLLILLWVCCLHLEHHQSSAALAPHPLPFHTAINQKWLLWIGNGSISPHFLHITRSVIPQLSWQIPPLCQHPAITAHIIIPFFLY